MRRALLWISSAVIGAGAGTLLWNRAPHSPSAIPSAPVAIPVVPPAAPVPATTTAAEGSHSAGSLRFRRLIIDTGGTEPEACLRFNTRLDPRPQTRYADYVAIAPAIQPSVRVAGNDLCLGGLTFGTDYTLTLRKGLPAAESTNASRLAADVTLPVSLSDRNPLVAMSGGGYLLPRRTTQGVTIDTVNVDRVHVHVLRVS